MQTKEIRDICFLDFQVARYASPALDILYHIFSSTRKPLRDKHYDELLNVYYTSLSEMVSRLGSDPEKLFRFSDLQTELKAYGKFAMLTGILLQPFVHLQQDDVIDMEEYAELVLKGEAANLFRKDSDKRNVEYSKAVNEILIDIISYGYDH